MWIWFLAEGLFIFLFPLVWFNASSKFIKTFKFQRHFFSFVFNLIKDKTKEFLPFHFQPHLRFCSALLRLITCCYILLHISRRKPFIFSFIFNLINIKTKQRLEFHFHLHLRLCNALLRGRILFSSSFSI